MVVGLVAIVLFWQSAAYCAAVSRVGRSPGIE